MLDRQRVLLREAIDAGDGVVVDCQGDAMFAAFRSASAAAQAAVRAQTHMAREEWPDGTAVRVRMALHTGEPHRRRPARLRRGDHRSRTGHAPLEQRINEGVADVLERALDLPFGKPGGKEKGPRR